jgi:hypothetical protein
MALEVEIQIEDLLFGVRSGLCCLNLMPEVEFFAIPARTFAHTRAQQGTLLAKAD